MSCRVMGYFNSNLHMEAVVTTMLKFHCVFLDITTRSIFHWAKVGENLTDYFMDAYLNYFFFKNSMKA